MDVTDKGSKLIFSPGNVRALRKMLQAQNTQETHTAHNVRPEAFAETEEEIAQCPVSKPVGQTQQVVIRGKRPWDAASCATPIGGSHHKRFAH